MNEAEETKTPYISGMLLSKGLHKYFCDPKSFEKTRWKVCSNTTQNALPEAAAAGQR